MPGRSIAVAGQWHLGTVIAACLADVGYDVVGLDPNLAVVEALRNGIPAVAEPGLAELVGRGIAAKTLRFETIESAVLDMVEIVWVAFDTPVDEDDRADSEWVIDQALAVLARAPQVILVIVSSQLPVGSVAALERGLRERGRTDVSCVSVPENLRLGQAISTFTAPDRLYCRRAHGGRSRAGAGGSRAV
jgi:UDPglucose 6-dehydrogenase